jgi:hypothetical protein
MNFGAKIKCFIRNNQKIFVFFCCLLIFMEILSLLFVENLLGSKIYEIKKNLSELRISMSAPVGCAPVIASGLKT